ncbi:CPBP family intramembrane glutamic endopeptidase [Corynebacterium alimapuense]|uniref:CPBP family intramembrane metalloprotease n=1 Tax=Corynebacterium alimapuense TaxID=1576874 RepID=A0A3M8KAW6_9CORY|nr:CPBP family intramembrane glutamic endopeptidase [Corynebacterium alimapuense]RNE50009.1 CPBP family intramembrane metalloprotease [Corynebacterium alimapuense]
MNGIDTASTGVDKRRLRIEILLVLAVSFGISGIRAVLRLTDALLDPVPLNQQQVALNSTQSQIPWLDLALQLSSATALLAYGGLALFLLAGDGIGTARPRWSDAAWGAGLAALIGIPGLVFYATAVHLGLSREVIPASLDHPVTEIPVLLVWSAANAFGEETVVVAYLLTRLKQLGWGLPAALAASSLLRGSYHLYQGISAGFGNIIMGVVYGWFYWKTGRLWPLVIAHFLIDAIAFVGYTAIGGNLSFLGL